MLSVRIKGEDEIVNKLRKLGIDGAKTLRNSLNRNTRALRKRISENAPVKTGALKRSLSEVMGKPQGTTVTNIIGISTGVDSQTKKRPVTYAQLIEEKHGFMSNKLDAENETITNNIMNDVRNIINTI